MKMKTKDKIFVVVIIAWGCWIVWADLMPRIKDNSTEIAKLANRLDEISHVILMWREESKDNSAEITAIADKVELMRRDM